MVRPRAKVTIDSLQESHVRNRLVPMTLTFVIRGRIKVMSIIVSHSPLNISDNIGDRGLVPKDHQ